MGLATSCLVREAQMPVGDESVRSEAVRSDRACFNCTAPHRALTADILSWWIGCGSLNTQIVGFL
ncbi:hypothetical protein J6590_052346 [Homalodisca vitripennis]|nr:hypothetical protein J6590_052346 [Homalodisca vitripennis]